MFTNLSAKKFLCISFAIACLFAGSRAGFADDTAADQNKPKVISINPPPDSKIALLSELKITFDQPMMPDEFNAVDASADKSSVDLSRVGIISQFCSYDSNNNTFTLFLALPENWNGQIKLCEFKSIDGVEANAVVVDYHTLRDNFSKDLQARFEKERQSSELRELLKKIREARAGIYSLSEKINQTVNFNAYKKTESIVIKMNKGGRFFVDMSGMFEITWEFGCDGNQCWYYYVTREKEEHLEKEDVKDINEIDISICDLFGLNKTDIDEVLRSNNLEYGGTSLYDRKQCYVIRSWKAIASLQYISCSVEEWLIDGKTYMPVQMTRFSTRYKIVYKYSYDSINMPIADAEFSPDSVTNIPGASEPLGDGYDTKFIKLIDGTSYGNMSISWGQRGPKGISRGGLN